MHPGEILGDEIEATEVSERDLAKALDVPLSRVTMILEGHQGITADVALRLARYFGTTPQLWLNLQQTRELRVAEINARAQVARAVTPRPSRSDAVPTACPHPHASSEIHRTAQ